MTIRRDHRLRIRRRTHFDFVLDQALEKRHEVVLSRIGGNASIEIPAGESNMKQIIERDFASFELALVLRHIVSLG